MKFCVSFVFFNNGKMLADWLSRVKCMKSLLEPEKFTGPSFVLFLSMEDMQNKKRTNTNQGNELVLYSFLALT